MFVNELMNKNAVVCEEDASLEKVFELMTETGSKVVTVVESSAHRIPLGTITEHDICLQIVGKGRHPRSLQASSVMNQTVVKASENLSLSQCVDLMQIKSTERVCVVDEDGMLAGILTLPEIEKHFQKQTFSVNPRSESAEFETEFTFGELSDRRRLQ